VFFDGIGREKEFLGTILVRGKRGDGSTRKEKVSRCDFFHRKGLFWISKGGEGGEGGRGR